MSTGEKEPAGERLSTLRGSVITGNARDISALTTPFQVSFHDWTGHQR